MSRLQCVSKGVGEHVFVSAMSMRLHVCVCVFAWSMCVKERESVFCHDGS